MCQTLLLFHVVEREQTGSDTNFRTINSTFKMVAVKEERISLIRDFSRGNEHRKMFSESAQMFIALRMSRI